MSENRRGDFFDLLYFWSATLLHRCDKRQKNYNKR